MAGDRAAGRDARAAAGETWAAIAEPAAITPSAGIAAIAASKGADAATVTGGSAASARIRPRDGARACPRSGREDGAGGRCAAFRGRQA